MNMPGFTAEASLYKTRAHYHMVGTLDVPSETGRVALTSVPNCASPRQACGFLLDPGLEFCCNPGFVCCDPSRPKDSPFPPPACCPISNPNCCHEQPPPPGPEPCPSGQAQCGVIVTGQTPRFACCPSGQKCCDTRAHLCCLQASTCCGDVCCNPGQLCITPGACCAFNKACGINCCGEGEECVNQNLGLCCPDGQIDCGAQCCPRDRCINGVCCPEDQVCNGRCCGPNESCADGACCSADNVCRDSANPGSAICCDRGWSCCGGGNTGRFPFCCYPGWQCCGDHCCPGDWTCCGGSCCEPGLNCRRIFGRFYCTVF